jgi:hypothetical protein
MDGWEEDDDLEINSREFLPARIFLMLYGIHDTEHCGEPKAMMHSTPQTQSRNGMIHSRATSILFAVSCFFMMASMSEGLSTLRALLR